MANKTWFSIEARGGAEGAPQTAKIEIYDEIGGWGVSAADFKKEFTGLGDVESIELSIHSPGGSVIDGWAIYNIIKSSKARVVAKIEGLAASMATIVCCAADSIEMPANAFFMVHNPSGFTFGGAEDMRDYADLLDKMEAGIRSAYVSKTGQSEEVIDKLMAEETWLTGVEAKELGFVDVVTDALEMAALTGAVSACAEELSKAGLSVPMSDEMIITAVADEESEEESEEESVEGVEEEVADEVEAEEVVEPVDQSEVSDLDEHGELVTEPQGFVERVKAAIRGRNNVAALTDHSEMRNTINSLEAKLADSETAIESMRAEVAAKSDELVALRADQASVLDLVTEAGFAPDVAASLPMPDGGDGDEIKAAEAALADAESKGGREVYAAVKRLQDLRNQQ